MDVTVVNPLQRLLVVQAAARHGHALTTRFNEKMTKHGEACRRAGLAFVPLVVETYTGGLAGGSRADQTLVPEISCPACQG